MTSRRPRIRVAIDNVNHSAFVSGYGSYDLIIRCGGKPMYSRRRKAWSTSEGTALDVLAAAEHEGYAVQYEQLRRDAS